MLHWSRKLIAKLPLSHWKMYVAISIAKKI